MTRVRRSILFMPGDSLRKITKAATQLTADAIVMDLEDGVALDRKEEARQIVTEACLSLDFGHREKLIRINPTNTSWWMDDITQTLDAKPDGYVIPKVESGPDLKKICDFLSEAEHTRGVEPHSIHLIAIIETARGVLLLPEIAGATKRLSALAFGSEDLAGDIGAIRTPEGWEVFYARSAVVTAAAAYRLDAIDTIYPNFQDPEGLKKEALFARQMGYRGKMAIHPGQIKPINQVFFPSPEEIKYAQELLEIHEKHQAEGTGAFAYKGKMVDMPMIRSAQKIIEQVTSLQSRSIHHQD